MHEATLQPAQGGRATELRARAGARPALARSRSHAEAIVLWPLTLLALVLALGLVLGAVWPVFPFPQAAPVLLLLGVSFAFGVLRRVRAALVLALGLLVAVAYLAGGLWTAAVGLLVAVPPACLGLVGGWAWASRRGQATTEQDEDAPVAAAYANAERRRDEGEEPSHLHANPAQRETLVLDPNQAADELPEPAPPGPPDGPAREAADVEFPVVVRGYDRKAVDEYLAYVSRLLSELRSTHSPRAAVQRELDRVGEETAGILQRAHATADSITARSRAQADYRLKTAEHEAASAVAAAEERVRELEAETEAIWQERQRLIEDTRMLAESILALADEAAERLTGEDWPGEAATAKN